MDLCDLEVSLLLSPDSLLRLEKRQRAGERGCLGEAWRSRGAGDGDEIFRPPGRCPVPGPFCPACCGRAGLVAPSSVAEPRSPVPRREEEAQCEAEALRCLLVEGSGAG